MITDQNNWIEAINSQFPSIPFEVADEIAYKMSEIDKILSDKTILSEVNYYIKNNYTDRSRMDGWDSILANDVVESQIENVRIEWRKQKHDSGFKL